MTDLEGRYAPDAYGVEGEYVRALDSGRYYARWVETDGTRAVERVACNCGYRSNWVCPAGWQLDLEIGWHPAH